MISIFQDILKYEKIMILHIDTTGREEVTIKLTKVKKVLISKTFFAFRKQAEKLLPEIDKLLRKTKASLSDIETVQIANHGGSFTSLRIGVTTANALAYAIGSALAGTAGKPRKAGKISVVEPIYNSEPDIILKTSDKR
jgi:tRNA A37 threonylcarbamoyladenosine modification protein TsaB